MFSAEITKAADGTLEFAHSILMVAGPDPEQCDGGVAAEEGCLRPQAQAIRPLDKSETDQVNAVFAEVTYHRKPDQICRELAVDPCMIERHAWDARELSDYFCGADRLTDNQRTDIRKLLTGLRSAE